MTEKKILLAHGSGGRLMHNLIKGLLLKKLGNPVLKELADAAFLGYRERLALTTDSFVVSPLFFPGGDIGKLSVCGTVNDLVVSGAQPEYLSLALIIEEGLDYALLEKVVASIAATAKAAGVRIVTGDLKVVERGACDKLFINTCGVGRVITRAKLSAKNIRPGDKVIITGAIAEHGLAVLAKRKELDLGFNLKSDCAFLNRLLIPVIRKCPGIKIMRDPTRGGLATTLNELAEAANSGIFINEKDLPLTGKARVACELLGIDPLYIASEGRAVVIIESKQAAKALRLLNSHPLGRQARVIGCVSGEAKGKLVLNTVAGAGRIVDMLTSEALPRIC